MMYSEPKRRWWFAFRQWCCFLLSSVGLVVYAIHVYYRPADLYSRQMWSSALESLLVTLRGANELYAGVFAFGDFVHHSIVYLGTYAVITYRADQFVNNYAYLFCFLNVIHVPCLLWYTVKIFESKSIIVAKCCSKFFPPLWAMSTTFRTFTCVLLACADISDFPVLLGRGYSYPDNDNYNDNSGHSSHNSHNDRPLLAKLSPYILGVGLYCLDDFWERGFYRILKHRASLADVCCVAVTAVVAVAVASHDRKDAVQVQGFDLAILLLVPSFLIIRRMKKNSENDNHSIA